MKWGGRRATGPLPSPMARGRAPCDGWGAERVMPAVRRADALGPCQRCAAPHPVGCAAQRWRQQRRRGAARPGAEVRPGKRRAAHAAALRMGHAAWGWLCRRGPPSARCQLTAPAASAVAAAALSLQPAVCGSMIAHRSAVPRARSRVGAQGVCCGRPGRVPTPHRMVLPNGAAPCGCCTAHRRVRRAGPRHAWPSAARVPARHELQRAGESRGVAGRAVLLKERAGGPGCVSTCWLCFLSVDDLAHSAGNLASPVTDGARCWRSV